VLQHTQRIIQEIEEITNINKFDMKKVILFLFVVMCVLCANAQGIYTKVTKYDKFDDVVWTRQVKTLITQTDTTFVIETKGEKPTEYRYLDTILFSSHEGRRDSIVNLVADVYGFQDKYVVFTQSDIDECVDKVMEELKDLPDSLVYKAKIKMLVVMELIGRMDKLPQITIRYISKYSFSYEYDTDLFWIRFPDGTRLIYKKD
jgi:hypothetical protein